MMSGRANRISFIACIIVDQCSRVFFDRTKPKDVRPEVMDLFSGALGQMVCTRP